MNTVVQPARPATTVDDWAGWYEDLAPGLIRFATMLVGPSAAEDVLSEAMIRVLRQAPGTAIANPSAYLHRAVVNTAQNHHRSGSRRRRGESRLSPPLAIEQPEIRSEVRAAVASLSVQQRAVVYLAYWADLTPPRIVEQLGISEGTVRRHLARARAKLRGALDD